MLSCPPAGNPSKRTPSRNSAAIRQTPALPARRRTGSGRGPAVCLPNGQMRWITTTIITGRASGTNLVVRKAEPNLGARGSASLLALHGQRVGQCEFRDDGRVERAAIPAIGCLILPIRGGVL